jgi:PAS domain S-box-containing protein
VQEIVLGKEKNRAAPHRWTRTRRGSGLIRFTITLLLVVGAAYAASYAQAGAVHWTTLAWALPGLLLLSVLLYDARGSAIGIVGMALDVIEARRLRQRLEESSARLDIALRAAQMGTWAWNSESDDIDLDASERQLFGIGDGPHKALALAAYIHPDDFEPLKVAVRRALREGVPVDYEFRTPAESGGWRWVEGSAMRYCAPGKPTYLIGVNRDITQRKRQELDLAEATQRAERAMTALAQSRTDLELALRSGRFGIWHSESHDIEQSRPEERGLDEPVEWDANVRRIFGRTAEEKITRRHYFEALHPDDRDRVIANLAKTADGGHEYSDKYRIVRPDGEARWVSVYAAPVSWADPGTGKPRFVMTGIVRDATDEENLKADLRQKAREAQMASEAKARFLAMMSHEIRTPMNGVVGMIELLADTPMSPEQQQMLKTCKDSAFVLLTILNDILDFSKIEAGKLELDYLPLSPRRLVDGVGEALGTHATQRGIDLDVYVAPDVPRRLVGDRVRLRQILTNLVSNAIKFTERGGVTVMVSLEPGDPSDRRACIRFAVADSGIGMGQDTIRNLFQAFQQADAATTRRFGGTGLGLSIVKHLTELMGGQVECESRPQHGSCFSVVIPFEPVAVGERDWGYPLADVRVLAIVAHPLRRQIIAEHLRQFDAAVEFFDTADALCTRARHAVAQGAVNVVLLDRDQSVSERAGLRRRFAETPGLSHLPFVVVRSNEPVQAYLIPDATLISGNPITRINLIHGIAVALGRVSPLAPAIAVEHLDEPAEPTSRKREEAAGRLILLAEDNPTNREVITYQLTRLGYACDAAEDGERAWAMLQTGTRYGLLLTDCHMPRLDGYQLTRRIRERERGSDTPALPIVAITANALQGENERCLALGMSAYLAKPLRLQELKQLLGEFLPQAPAGGPVYSSHPLAQRRVASESGRFPELEELLQGDEARIRRVLDVFEQSTRRDCEQLVAAHAGGDRQRVRHLAHKLKSGCRQLGDEAAVIALESVERRAFDSDLDSEEEFDRAVSAACNGLHRLLERVRAYLGNGQHP